MYNKKGCFRFVLFRWLIKIVSFGFEKVSPLYVTMQSLHAAVSQYVSPSFMALRH